MVDASSGWDDLDQGGLQFTHGEGAGADAHGKGAMTGEHPTQDLHALAGHEAQLKQSALEGAAIVMAGVDLADDRHRASRQLVKSRRCLRAVMRCVVVRFHGAHSRIECELFAIA